MTGYKVNSCHFAAHCRGLDAVVLHHRRQVSERLYYVKNSNVSNIVLLLMRMTSLVRFEFRKTSMCDTVPGVNVVLVGQLHK